MADDYARRGFDVPARHIVLTASTSDAYGWLFKLLADAGDEVLVPRPSYPLFDHLTRLEGIIARSYDLEYHGAWSIDFSSVEAALSPRTRAVLIVSPNNPTGSFVKQDDLDRLASSCASRGVALIADEVFADYELDADARASAGRVIDRRDVLAFSLGGLSKSIGLPQVKLGWMALAGPDALVDAALERLELVCDTYLSVATPVQASAAELLIARRASPRRDRGACDRKLWRVAGKSRGDAVVRPASQRGGVVRGPAGAVAAVRGGARPDAADARRGADTPRLFF